MNVKTTGETYDYWMCKYWFYGQPHTTLKGWRQTGQSRWYENLKGSETFAVPLYHIASSEELEQLVIEPLLSFEQQA
jgi:preprotein translocase subunit Sec63